MKLSFHGADRSVTGSCHLLECAGKRLLVDCGLYQGGREIDEENAGEFGFDPAAIDVLLLTHAHLDHCGRIPLLLKRGFKGEIISTAATRELARVVMLDSAHLQEEEATRHTHHAARRGHASRAPLYGTLDALNALGQFRRTAEAGGERRSVIFSGDLGNGGRPILREGIEKGRLPRNLPVFLDSPMAISATDIFRRHPECQDAAAAAMFARDCTPSTPSPPT